MYISPFKCLQKCKRPPCQKPGASSLGLLPIADRQKVCHWGQKSLIDRLFVCQCIQNAVGKSSGWQTKSLSINDFCIFLWILFGFLESLTDKKSVSGTKKWINSTSFFGSWQTFCLSVLAKVCHWQTKSLSAIAKWCHWQTKSLSVTHFPNYIIQKRLPTRDKCKQSLAGILLELSVRCS